MVAARATAFTFFGVAVIVGVWLAGRIARGPRFAERVATIGVAVLCGVGGILFGFGPRGPSSGNLEFGADEASLGSPSLAVAHWADMNIPAGTHVAADRDNGDLLDAIAGLDPVTPQAGLVDPETIYFDHHLMPYDISLIRRADIRYVFVDDRLAQGLPVFGVYVAEGEPQTRLTLAELNKFDSYPGIRRVYDNGPIKVYDVSALLSPSERAAQPTNPDGGVGSGIQVAVLVLALFVVGLWVLRLRRRREPFANLEHLVVCGLAVTFVLGIAGAFVIRLTRVQPEVAGAAILLALAALSFMPQSRSATPKDAPKVRRSRPQLFLAVLGVALLGVGASVATVAALKEWTPPPELAVVRGPDGQAVAQVQLGSAGPEPAQLMVAHDGRLLWVSDLARTTGQQKVHLPAVALADGSRVTLVTNGKAVRLVGN